uniref:Thioredoxin domain-containing protein n=1 Tax=Palpitomonas bilix TaxID=652834 RepID=A0A7S3LUX6_9EUKA|mmetsp:Transcript_47698/g.123681  ORF Transcript_47698/g.123681 Transcript_47698/m.123681 type:complete len:448 (+) Transcript_47698:38-1381(+)
MRLGVFVSALLLLTSACSASAMYYRTDDVIQLTAKDFSSKVLSGDGIWVVEFYAPWCGHCQRLAPEWKRVATALKGIVNVAAVDLADEKNKPLGGQYGIQGFPTIKVFEEAGKAPRDYNGQRTAQAIVDDVLQTVKRLTMSRLSGKKSKSSSSKSSGSGGGSKGSDVIQLDISNFDSSVLQSEDGWMVEFFAPWCGHCQRLAPEWEEAATTLKGQVKLGAVNADAEKELAGRYGVSGYPTIVYFPPTAKGKKKTAQSAVPYQGERSAQAIVDFALQKQDELGLPPTIDEVYSQKTLDDSCYASKLCFIGFLPHIMDSGKEGRMEYITAMQTAAKKFRKLPVKFVWAEGGSSEERLKFESSIQVGGSGYPALAAVAKGKGRVGNMLGAFSAKQIEMYVNGVMNGKMTTRSLPSDMPTFGEGVMWDGEDAAVDDGGEEDKWWLKDIDEI